MLCANLIHSTRPGNWHIRHPGATEEIGVHVFRLWEFKENSNVVKGIYVDTGVPYSDGKLEVGELTLTETYDHSPKHCKVYFPLEAGEYATVVFVGGLYSLALAELYSVVLKKIAAHGFFVFGIDYDYPAKSSMFGHDRQFGQDINIYFEQIEFFKSHVKTVSTPRYDVMGLMCHSAGCDVTLKMIQDKRAKFNATAFSGPFSTLILTKPAVNDVPALIYGTEMSEVGLTKCALPGMDYKQLYTEWKCPKIGKEVAKFSHCDIMDPLIWEACSRVCTTSDRNATELAQYRQVAQGMISGFFMTMLQGRPDAISYVANETNVPLKLLMDKSDLNCAF